MRSKFSFFSCFGDISDEKFFLVAISFKVLNLVNLSRKKTILSLRVFAMFLLFYIFKNVNCFQALWLFTFSHEHSNSSGDLGHL